MTPDPRDELAKLHALAEAYAVAIDMNAELHGRQYRTEALAAVLGAMVALYADLDDRETFWSVLMALGALVANTGVPAVVPDPVSARRGGLVNALLRDMEGF